MLPPPPVLAARSLSSSRQLLSRCSELLPTVASSGHTSATSGRASSSFWCLRHGSARSTRRLHIPLSRASWLCKLAALICCGACRERPRPAGGNLNSGVLLHQRHGNVEDMLASVWRW